MYSDIIIVIIKASSIAYGTLYVHVVRQQAGQISIRVRTRKIFVWSVAYA